MIITSNAKLRWLKHTTYMEVILMMFIMLGVIIAALISINDRLGKIIELLKPKETKVTLKGADILAQHERMKHRRAGLTTDIKLDYGKQV